MQFAPVIEKQTVRAIIQRVSQASVSVEGSLIARIPAGLCVFVGVGAADQHKDAERLASKIVNLRIFEDEQAKMNLSVSDVKGEVLVVSQFTLYAECSRGHRPSFTEAAPPEHAEVFYNDFVNCLKTSGLKVCTGQFRAKMDVTLSNDGPVTLILQT